MELPTFRFWISRLHSCERIKSCCFEPSSLWYFVTIALGNECTLLSEGDFQLCASQFYESTEKSGFQVPGPQLRLEHCTSLKPSPLSQQSRNPLVEQGVMSTLLMKDLQYDGRVQAWPSGSHLFWILKGKIFLL